jgi:hypothetical protein
MGFASLYPSYGPHNSGSASFAKGAAAKDPGGRTAS